MSRQIKLSDKTRSLLLAVLSGLLYGLSFPPFNLTFLAWISLVPLLLIPSHSFKSQILWGIFTGFIANLFIFWWLIPTFNAAHQPLGIALLSWMALSLLLALYFGFFKAAENISPSVWLKPLFLAAVWVALEHIRSHILSGFPWVLLAHTQYKNTNLIQIASVTGTLGVSFFLILFQVCLANFYNDRKRFLVVISILSVVYIGGYLRVRQLAAQPVSQSISIGILQGNIDQYIKWDDQYAAAIRNQYQRLALSQKDQKPDVVVWPETAVPGWIPNEPYYVAWVAAIATQTNAYHLVGAASENNIGSYNSAFLFSPTGNLEQQYDKQHMVPFGEYVPLKSILGKVTPYLGQLGDFEAGQKPGIFLVNGVRLAPTICYEMIFPLLVRKSVRAGADVIVNITNDGWYLNTGAPLQHFVTNVFRAVETGRPVVRAANTGISGVIDPLGHILLATPLMKVAMPVISVEIKKDFPETFYIKWGDWFPWLCLLMVVTILAACLVNSRKKLRS